MVYLIECDFTEGNFMRRIEMMNIPVEHRDVHGNVRTLSKNISRLEFLKHFVLAGQSFMPKLSRRKKTIGVCLYYDDYLSPKSFNNNYFSEPKGWTYTPTAKAHFSNLAGAAFADYLAKEIDGVRLTLNYEAAMKMRGLPIQGKRPDFIGVRGDRNLIAIEAKGYAARFISSDRMKKHVGQANAGSIAVSKSVASVAFNLYNRVRVKYYDPESKDSENNPRLISEMIKHYYSGAVTYINEKFFFVDKVRIMGNDYYILFPRIRYFYPFYFGYKQRHFKGIIKILLDTRLKEFAESGEFDWRMKPYRDENTYVDVDGIGLTVEDDCEYFLKLSGL